MNIGLVYNNKGQTQGGGFTFQEEILKNINLINDNNISFTLICSKQFDNNFSKKLDDNFKNIIALNRNIYDRFRENLVRNFSFISERTLYQSKLDIICKKNN